MFQLLEANLWLVLDLQKLHETQIQYAKIQDTSRDHGDTELEARSDFILSTDSGETCVTVTAQAINLEGNNRIWICNHAQNLRQNPDPQLPRTFVLKEFSRHDNGEYKNDEVGIYTTIKDLQGIAIPNCYGEVTWYYKDDTCSIVSPLYSGIALEYLEGFHRLRPQDIKDPIVLQECRAALNAISGQGVLHGDVGLRNLMWHPSKREIRVIDFEDSKSSIEEWERDYQTGEATGRPIATIQEQNLIDLESVFRRDYS